MAAVWEQGETKRIDTRTQIEVAFDDLTIIGALPRSWPLYSQGTFTKAQAVAACRDDIFPWTIDPNELRWTWPRLRKDKPNGKPN